MPARRTRRRQEKQTETTPGSAGEAQRLDRFSMRARAEAPQMLSERALQERQAKLGETRRAPGPRRRRRAEQRIDESSMPDVEPSEAEEPAE
jgi:hypothetical protein